MQVSATPCHVEAVLSLLGDLSLFQLTGGPQSCRADGLWRRTCFEMFMHSGNGAYTEANVTSAGAWNLYRFDSYRAGMRELIARPPEVESNCNSHRASLRARWAGVPSGATLKPTLVLNKGEIQHYFAPAHAAGPPNFHTAVGAAAWQNDSGVSP